MMLGEEPLNMSSTYFLAMDWRNNEKSKPYVLVQSKDLVRFHTYLSSGSCYYIHFSFFYSLW